VKQINDNTENVPELLFDLFGSDKMNIYINRSDGTQKAYSAVTADRKLVELRKGSFDDAEIKIEVQEETIEEIFQSDNPLERFLDAFNSGEIKYEGLTSEGKIKETTVNITTSALSILQSIYSFFAGIFG